VAIYRDGSKRSQPLNVKKSAGKSARLEQAQPEPAEHRYSEEQLEAARRAPHRRRLPATRPSITHKFNMAGHEGYLNVGMFENGSPGELFITMAKEGSTVGGMMDAFATAISLCLQYGVPLDALVKKFSHQRFEPSGMTDNREIPFAKSIVDYIFRWMGMTFLEEYRKANAINRGEENPAPGASAKALARSQTVSRQKAAPEAVKDDAASVPGRADQTSATEGSRSDGALLPGMYVGADSKSDRRSPRPGRTARPAPATQASKAAPARHDRVDGQFSHFQEDAPACDVCGSITVRNGNCYKCFNCGSSLGCS
jgi:ribonucleoside-diphosphate reductase alpha chain